MTQCILLGRVRAELSPSAVSSLDETALLAVMTAVWGDVELGERLGGSEQFIWERLLHHAQRGYLTPRERQGVERTLALGYRPKIPEHQGPTDVDI